MIEFLEKTTLSIHQNPPDPFFSENVDLIDAPIVYRNIDVSIEPEESEHPSFETAREYSGERTTAKEYYLSYVAALSFNTEAAVLKFYEAEILAEAQRGIDILEKAAIQQILNDLSEEEICRAFVHGAPRLKKAAL